LNRSLKAAAAEVDPVVAPSLSVTRLALRNFRSFANLRVVVDGQPVVLTGVNGAGKTNLLEALSFLAPGRGLRRARLADVTRCGSGVTWALAARIGTPDGPTDVGTGLVYSRFAEPNGNEAHDADRRHERRAVKIDGAPVRGQAALSDVLSMQWLTPAMDRLFGDAASGRRRFLDRLVCGLDSRHATRVVAYGRTLRERTRVLRAEPGNGAWLAALEETMAAYGVAVAAARTEAVARLGQALAEATGPFPSARLEVAGLVEGWLTSIPALDAETRLADALRASRSDDAAAGGAAVGPHKSDLAVWHGHHAMPAEHCSTGEQKALLITIVLAIARLQRALTGAAPVLLLDEVTAHLDAAHRAALFDEICALGGQAWLTGTERGAFAGLEGRATFAEIVDGRIPDLESRWQAS